MNKLLTLGLSTVAVAGIVGLAGSMSVSAYQGDDTSSYGQFGDHSGNGKGNGGGYQASLDSRANVVGMTSDELEVALEDQTMSEIAIANGMNEEDFNAKMIDAASDRWEARGLDADEIAERVADRADRHDVNSADHEFGSGKGNHQGGYGQNR